VGALQRTRLPGGEFQALWCAEGLSVLGDQLAKVAVALVVYQRTGSAALSGLAYGLTFLPPLLSAPLLSGLADRCPRRTVMVVCCLVQAACVGAMALPGLPLALIIAGALLVAAVQSPFKAAQGAVVLDILGPERNKAGRARLTVIRETGQLAGLAGAAAVVAAIGAGPALLIDAASFLTAAVLLRAGLKHRPAVGSTSASGGPGRSRAVWRLLRTDRALRALALLITVIGVTAVPDAVIVPLAAQAGAPSWVIGPLLAADCFGLVLAAWFVEAKPAARQRFLIVPLAMLSMVPLALFALRPQPILMGALLVVSGAGSAYLPLAIGEFTERIRADVAGTANGLVNAALRASQGVAAIAAGVLAQRFSASMAVATVGLCGVLLTGVCALHWRRAHTTGPAC
jgi:MFS family permease